MPLAAENANVYNIAEGHCGLPKGIDCHLSKTIPLSLFLLLVRVDACRRQRIDMEACLKS